MTLSHDLLDEIMNLPVWDTHTHLEGSPKIRARDFWDFAHYFWFRQELEAAGYPKNAEKIDEAKREKAFLAAFDASRNTYWNRIVREVCRDLYRIVISDAGSLREINERIKADKRNANWEKDVCARIGVKTIVVGTHTPNNLANIADIIYYVPLYSIEKHIANTIKATNQKSAAADASDRIKLEVNDLYDSGYRAMRFDYPFGEMRCDVSQKPTLLKTGNEIDAIKLYVGHTALRALEERQFHLQIFAGVGGNKTIASTSLNDPSRIMAMHPIFAVYRGLTFEILNAAELSALDLVQAARNYPNVVPGGLWWFNFRASTYRLNMQYRIEALPANRVTLVASDARHIEWTYGKILLVKRLLAEFLADQIVHGWTDRSTALYTAKNWLYDTAARYYRRTVAPVYNNDRIHARRKS